MKTINHLIGIATFIAMLVTSTTFAQLDLPRGSQKATVSQTVGISKIYIKYSRPSVNGREVWGKLVPYGMNNLGFGTATESPWRAGANENTVIKFTDDVTIEGKPLKAGVYGLHMIVHENDTATLIFSNSHTAWGSYFYKPSEDALRVEVNTKSIPHTELLTYDFIAVDANSATAALNWEKKQIPFKIELDVTSIVLNDIRQKLENQPGFNKQSWEQAANYALNNGGDLDEALSWVNAAISGQFFSQQDFNNTNIKAGILNKLGRKDEAVAAIESYMPKASLLEMHQIGRQFITFGLTDKALDVFKQNEKNNKGQWPVHYGLARGYSAQGNYKEALKHLRIALKNAPNAGSKGRVQANIEKLEKGEDIN
ncbi:DUF2911 domain-containing protein [Pontimicrobium sp. IMCC45349]|uniref:DUF2911 domain-containing protein n=1 Tax=Pontimicrobium sp. IMCC45349 TaxID=3391574 RepID=UPI0039A13A13